MAMSRALRGAALIGAFTLLLSACTGSTSGPPPTEQPSTSASTTPSASASTTRPPTPEESARTSADLAPTDVITLLVPSTDPGGSYGDYRYEITEDSISSSFTLFDGTVIYAVSAGLSPLQRDYLELATENYVGTDPADRGPRCAHSGAITVEISGSISHRSEASSCIASSPMTALHRAVRELRGDAAKLLAEPSQKWTIEIRPWATDGPDDSAPVESYTLRGSGTSDGMTIQGESTPPGWGGTLAPGSGEQGPSLGQQGTGTVLTALNEVILGEDRAHCESPSAEVRIIQHDTPDLVWTTRQCPDQHPGTGLTRRR